MWNARSVFDMKLGEIIKTNPKKGDDEPLLQIFEKYIQKNGGLRNQGNDRSRTKSENRKASQNQIYAKLPYEHSLKCYVCNKSLSLVHQVDLLAEEAKSGATSVMQVAANRNEPKKELVERCPTKDCKGTIPSCAVCLKPVAILNP